MDLYPKQKYLTQKSSRKVMEGSHRKSLHVSLSIITLLLSWYTYGQTPNDALMMPKGDICILLNYDFGSFDQYWEGSKLRRNETIATLQRQTIMPMAAIGILENLNLYVGVPYVSTKSTEPNGGNLAGVKGFQDLGIALKYLALRKDIIGGELSLLSTVGFTTPASNYLADYMPYSLGFGAPELSVRGIVEYKLKNGLYVRTSLAHLWRGYAEAERDYYYSNGSRYSFWMDVPNAWSYEGILGTWLFDNSLRLELSYVGQNSTSGDDIRPYNAPQPTNEVDFDRVGFFGQYYFQGSIKGLGVQAYHNRVFSGLNTGKMNNTGLGLTYQFNFKKNENVQE